MATDGCSHHHHHHHHHLNIIGAMAAAMTMMTMMGLEMCMHLGPQVCFFCVILLFFLLMFNSFRLNTMMTTATTITLQVGT